jgi:hypothetical protein
VTILRSANHGAGGIGPLERSLDARDGQRIGTLKVFADASADMAEREELLAFIVPPVAMALDNAISYLLVEEYRRGLELRVAERTAS